MLKGVHHGRGAMRYANGDIYHGDWWKSRRHGLGAFVSNADRLTFPDSALGLREGE